MLRSARPEPTFSRPPRLGCVARLAGIARVFKRASALFALLAAAGCATHLLPAPELPGEQMLVREQLVIFSDAALPRQHRLFEDLTLLRDDVAQTLHLPTSDEPIHVHLFESSAKFQRFLRDRYPGVPSRRAIFVETDTRLAVYAHWGDRVAEDLRHEVSHGYLHAVLRDLPLWLDEGLAEYFEAPRGHQGINRPHLLQLASLTASGSWRPDLDRLENLRSVADMTQQDYAETWAWVHLLLESTPERRQVLLNYLATLRREGSASPPSSWIRRDIHEPEQALLRHLAELIARQGSPAAGDARGDK